MSHDRAPSPGGLHPAPHWSAVAGVVAPVVFVLTFTLDGLVLPGYDPVSMFVSELSIGAGGWVQRVNFVVTGGLVLLFCAAVARALHGGRGHRAGPLAIGAIGGGLALSGFFTTDPSVMVDQVTAEGLVHRLLGGVVFVGMPLSCFVVAARLRGGAADAFGRWSFRAGLALIALIVLLRISQVPRSVLWDWRGIVQRADLILYMSWLFGFATRLLRSRRAQMWCTDATV